MLFQKSHSYQIFKVVHFGSLCLFAACTAAHLFNSAPVGVAVSFIPVCTAESNMSDTRPTTVLLGGETCLYIVVQAV